LRSNSALEMVQGNSSLWLDHDDGIAPMRLAEVVLLLAAQTRQRLGV